MSLADQLNNKASNLKPTTINEHRGKEDTNDFSTEMCDEQNLIQSKAKLFARLLKQSKHFVVETGAGISTASRIPDYRGPNGIWTLKAQGVTPKLEISLDEAMPNYSHMALAELYKAGYLKAVVSTNVDGLHIKSGIDADKVLELHGNIFKEKCDKCGKVYLRNFDVLGSVKNRFTGRLCDDTSCDGKLKDTIINFGENLDPKTLATAASIFTQSDLVLVMGSSMRVAPANELPVKCTLVTPEKPSAGKLVICNLQRTPFDGIANVRVFSRCDEFMQVVMQELGIEVNPYQGKPCADAEDLAALKKTLRFDPDFDNVSKIDVLDQPPPSRLLSEVLKFDKNALKSVNTDTNTQQQ